MHQHQPQPIHPSAYPGHILHMGSPAPEGYDFDVLADTSTTTDQVETANHHYFEVEHELDVWRRGVLQVPVQCMCYAFFYFSYFTLLHFRDLSGYGYARCFVFSSPLYGRYWLADLRSLVVLGSSVCDTL